MMIDATNQMLIDLYPNHSNKELASMLGISYSTVKNRAHKLGLHKDPDFRNSGCFRKGQEAWNKGMKGLQIGGKETQFKKGHLPHNTEKNGAISIRTDSCGRRYKWIRIKKAEWKMLHVQIWEAANGPVQEGNIIIFKDKNSMNCQLDNLKQITRAEHAQNNHNREKAADTMRKLWDIEKTRYIYGLGPKTGLGEIIRRKRN